MSSKLSSKKKGKLILKDGTSFEGEVFGAECSSSGEVVFSTGMVGYPESITDPSYCGQILTFTYPLIGNYGVPAETANKDKFRDLFESEKIHLKGLVVAEYADSYSHWHAQKSLSDYLKEYNVPGLSGIDTRALTTHLRAKGSMPGKIVVDDQDVDLYDPNVDNLVAEVSVKKPVTYKRGPKRIVMIDCGVKNNTLRNFLKHDITVYRVPWNYDFLAEKEPFDGLFISNGPGDPAMLTEVIATIKKCMDRKIPIFGICLGNQLLALAAGAKTYKMKFGNRSQNQPCIDAETGRCYMTTQNHGFSVDEKTLPKDWVIWFRNLNDQTVEGIKHKKLPFMSVQFHPEACPGPVDTQYLFDLFIEKL